MSATKTFSSVTPDSVLEQIEVQLDETTNQYRQDSRWNIQFPRRRGSGYREAPSQAVAAEGKEPWLQLARAKSEAKRAGESVSDPSSVRAKKRRRNDYDTPESSVENHGSSQDLHSHYAQASQSSLPSGEYQLQPRAPDMLSYPPSNCTFKSSNNTTPGSPLQSKTVDEQRPPSSWTGSFSENSIQSLARNEPAKLEQGQNTAEEYERDEDSILTADSLSKLMREAGMEPLSLGFPPANETE
ncbi:hypothetical protein F4782DRAFT_544564 [Xylaria castorea]|nr:hypothetical protein F4782DRAFT_544564 [Xylaria castorea]